MLKNTLQVAAAEAVASQSSNNQPLKVCASAEGNPPHSPSGGCNGKSRGCTLLYSSERGIVVRRQTKHHVVPEPVDVKAGSFNPVSSSDNSASIAPVHPTKACKFSLPWDSGHIRCAGQIITIAATASQDLLLRRCIYT